MPVPIPSLLSIPMERTMVGGKSTYEA